MSSIMHDINLCIFGCGCALTRQFIFCLLTAIFFYYFGWKSLMVEECRPGTRVLELVRACCSASWPGSAGSSWFVELFVLRLVPGLVRLIGLILEVVPRGSDASTGRIDASSDQHVFGSARGFAGAREGSRLTAIGSSSLSLEPGSEQLEDHTR